ncbi:MAG: hypothetical protein JXA91_07710 [Candidatus Thermoplasmatota archaeon]|nr:hypothetical protein [Candidatus Thermoplasmatota archaeon]
MKMRPLKKNELKIAIGVFTHATSYNRAYKRWSQSLPWPEAHFASAKPTAKRLVCPSTLFAIVNQQKKTAQREE